LGVRYGMKFSRRSAARSGCGRDRLPAIEPRSLVDGCRIAATQVPAAEAAFDRATAGMPAVDFGVC
jgi:hypothetical protein